MSLTLFLSSPILLSRLLCFTLTEKGCCVGCGFNVSPSAFFFTPLLPQMVARLKQQVQALKEELAVATGEERTDDLSQDDMEW